jgi:acylglycerol lipase
MGGAVAINISRADSGKWDGMILVAPMCKIADKIRPPWIVQEILRRTAFLLPTLPIVPAEDIADNAFKLPEKRAEGKANPTAFLHKPRLGTAVQLLLVSEDIEKHLEEVTTPFLLMHGAADIVTDPEVSKALYERSSSKDKTFKLYDGMWHALTEGEPPENVALVMRDMISWLGERSRKGGVKLSNTSQNGIDYSDNESTVVNSL